MPESNTNVAEYLKEISDALKFVQKDVDLAIASLRHSIESGGTIWILGNGGSLAIAQHLAQDLVKLRGIKAHALSCPSMITAFTNDDTFENSFSAPLNILRKPGDPVIIFSCSGASRNYQNVLKIGIMPTVSIVGMEGGFLKMGSSNCIHVRSTNYQVCESAFSIIADMINYGLEKKL